MSDMKPKAAIITLGGVDYPLMFTLNAIDDIQDHFNIAIGDLGTLFEDDQKKIKAVRYLLTVLVNEGLDCEADETGEQRPHVTERFVGRKINTQNMNELVTAIYGAFSGSLPDAEENPQTGQ